MTLLDFAADLRGVDSAERRAMKIRIKNLLEPFASGRAQRIAIRFADEARARSIGIAQADMARERDDLSGRPEAELDEPTQISFECGVEPDLAGATRVIRKSGWFGFPPRAVRRSRADDPPIRRFADVLTRLSDSDHGRAMLRLLHLDGIVADDPARVDGIAARMRDAEHLR